MTDYTPLPVIVGFGGYNPAGRISHHQAFKRMVINSISDQSREEMLCGLAVMMQLVAWENGKYVEPDGRVLDASGVVERHQQRILSGTLMRRIEPAYFDVEHVSSQRDVALKAGSETSFIMRRSNLPKKIPPNWSLRDIDDRDVEIHVEGEIAVKIESLYEMAVQAAGQLPSGFDPADLYNSRFHPRGLQLAIIGASDALNSVGIPWRTIANSVAPDEIGVYATSAMGQNDGMGNAGMLQARLRSDRATSKQLPLGLNSMPADFINAYVCGNVGTTGSIAGACASFLYNLRLGVDDIRAGRRRVVIVGAAEAPILPEIIEGYNVMSALASDDRLRNLDDTDVIDYTRACRPFSDNCGFSLGESSQYVVLMDDALAIELGADIHGAVNDVFVNADGFKKSISSPGAGNYITLAKAVASARAIVGIDGVQNRSFVQAHGSSTPQNRVTESVILNQVAHAFGISSWPISAIKCYLGHPLGPASGDQLAASLGTFATGIQPGIGTITHIADDVVADALDLLIQDRLDVEMDVAFLNSKGFGGNNATASVLSPHIAHQIIARRQSDSTLANYQARLQDTRQQSSKYNQDALHGVFHVIYNFGESIIDESAIQMTGEELVLPGFERPVPLNLTNPFG